MNHIASFSGGKDSTAMVLRLIAEGLPLDEIVFFDTGWEFPQMYEHIARSATWSATGRTPKLDRLATMAVRQHAEIEQMWRDAPPPDMDAPTVDALAGAVAEGMKGEPNEH